MRELDLFLANFIRTNDPDAKVLNLGLKKCFFYQKIFQQNSKPKIEEADELVDVERQDDEQQLSPAEVEEDENDKRDSIWGTGVFSAYELKMVTKSRRRKSVSQISL